MVFDKPTKVAHGGGPIDNIPRTNSIEAIRTNYGSYYGINHSVNHSNNYLSDDTSTDMRPYTDISTNVNIDDTNIDTYIGYRYFEIDLIPCQDNILTAHDGMEELYGLTQSFTETKFNDISKFMNRYTPYTLDELISEVEAHSDIYIICDVKAEHNRLYSEIYERSRARSLLYNFIPLCYDENTLEYVKRLFPSWFFIMWGIENRSHEEKIEFCQAFRPERIWMWNYEYDTFISELKNITCLGVHGDINIEESKYFLNEGVHIMTDLPWSDIALL